MAVFYSDHPSLSLATMIYKDAAFVEKADDGYYSDQTISRRLITIMGTKTLQAAEACANCGNPTVTLTFDEFLVDNTGLGGQFNFVLTGGTLLSTITIDNAKVTSYTTSDCTTGAVVLEKDGIEIAAGFDTGIGYIGSVNCTLRPYYSKINSLTVNGTSVTSGDTIIIDGISVLINILTNCLTVTCIN